ncbi:uncharacterized protein BYT42DRAFT_612005 [Radiomyces spectabilis]|uniref:uncharacterized protein n=1 Tax=Radiomyces spectabilis TaxID=64574 RepID=UPI00221E8153|nr:uncharacterized protein BYT42DRAFT_612005 [Radiomyces spectabilis]KAI8384292.1 hypothetical protein BYT42DRAFT_612005 [Radiomyces spectabilis]
MSSSNIRKREPSNAPVEKTAKQQKIEVQRKKHEEKMVEYERIDALYNVKDEEMISALNYTIITEGEGRAVSESDQVRLHHTARTDNSGVLDDQVIKFQVGVGKVHTELQLSTIGMKKHGKRVVAVNSAFTLPQKTIFEIELLAIL